MMGAVDWFFVIFLSLLGLTIFGLVLFIAWSIFAAVIDAILRIFDGRRGP